MRYLKFETCEQCPFREHKGGFGTPAYVPRCGKTGETLPHSVVFNEPSRRPVARPSFTIPDSCPLDATKPEDVSVKLLTGLVEASTYMGVVLDSKVTETTPEGLAWLKEETRKASAYLGALEATKLKKE